MMQAGTVPDLSKLSMDEAVWLDDMRKARKDMIIKSDRIVLDKFRRTNWRQKNIDSTPLPSQRRSLPAGSKVSLAYNPLLLSTLVLAGLLFLIVCLLFVNNLGVPRYFDYGPGIVPFSDGLLSESVSPAVPGQIINHVTNYNYTRVVQEVSVGDSKECTAFSFTTLQNIKRKVLSCPN